MEGIVSEKDEHLSSELVKHKRWEKKRKHRKDNKYLKGVVNARYVDYCGRTYKKNAYHKHLRSQKHFTQEEYFDDAYIDVDEGYWCVYDEDLGCHVAEEEDNWWLSEQFPTQDDFLEEIGCEYLGKNFDWHEELLINGFYDGCYSDIYNKFFVKNIVVDKGKLKLKHLLTNTTPSTNM